MQMPELVLPRLVVNPTSAPATIPTLRIVDIMLKCLGERLVKQAALLAAREATAATVSVVFGWIPILGRSAAEVAAYSVASIKITISRLNEAKDLIKAGEFSKGLNMLAADERTEMLSQLAEHSISYAELTQYDPRWSDLRLSSTKNMRQVGCYITSMASAFDHMGYKFDQETVDPGILAQYLKSKRMIDSDATLKADAFSNFKMVLEDDFSFTFDKCLSAFNTGKIVLVEIKDVSPHFMLMKGINEEGNIRVMDPAGTRNNIKPEDITGLRVYYRQ